MAEQAEILKHLEAASHEISSKGLTLDDEARNKALAVARDLVASLEKPQEVIMRFGYHVRLYIYVFPLLNLGNTELTQ